MYFCGRTISLRLLPQRLLSTERRLSYKLNHLTHQQKTDAIKDHISYVDYSILLRQSNRFRTKRSKLFNFVSLPDFFRQVNHNHSITEPSSPLNINIQPKKNITHSLFILLLISLHYSGLDSKKLESMSSEIRHLRNVTHTKLGIPKDPKLILKKRYNIKSLDSKVQTLLSLYILGDSSYSKTDINVSTLHYSNVKVSLCAILIFARHEFEEILKWLSSISAPSVEKSCHELSGLYEIPDFLIMDVMERVPKSEYDVQLMFDLYQRKRKMVISKSSLRNMIRNIKTYCYYLLPDFVEELLKKQTMNNTDLNELIVELAEIPNDRHYEDLPLMVLNSQKLVFDTISQNGEIEVMGKLGIALALFDVEYSKSFQLYTSLQDEPLTNRERQLMNLLKLKFSDSPQHLIQNFDSFNLNITSNLWDEFIVKAKEFSLIDKESSKRLLDKYENRKFATNSKSSLFQEFDDIKSILVAQSKIGNDTISVLLKKLYKLDPADVSSELPFYDSESAARYLFHSISEPSRSVCGAALLNESRINSEGLFDLYNHLLKKYCDNDPDEKCLLSLLRASNRDLSLKWNNRYASQVAVHEFRRVLKQNSKDTQRNLVPSDSLWQIYILVCGKASYIPELSEILEIWESLKFTPSKKTLAMLLGALPSGVGERIRTHSISYHQASTVTVGNDHAVLNDWDWPSNFEIKHWRSKMTFSSNYEYSRET